MIKGYTILGLVMAIIFGMGWIVGKSALDQVPPILMAALRFGVAAAVVLPFTGWPKLTLWHLLPLSVLALSAPYSLSNIGLSHLDVSLTILLVQLEAPVLIGLSALVLGERPSKLALFGVLLAVSGVVLVAGTPDALSGMKWIVLVVGSIFVWAIGQIWIRKAGIKGSVALLGALSAIAAPQLLLASLILEPSGVALLTDVTLSTWLEIIYLGVAMTAVGIGIWYYLLSKYEVTTVAPFLLLVPAISILGGIFFLGEEVSATRWFGAAVITLGVALTTLKPASSRTVDAETYPSQKEPFR